jgi:hypothetical protein
MNVGGPIFDNGPTIEFARIELAFTKTLNVNITSAVIPSFKITDITNDPTSLAVGVIVNVFPKNVTKDG